MNALYKTLCVRSSAQMHSARTERSREAAAQRESLVRANSYTLWRGYQFPPFLDSKLTGARCVGRGAGRVVEGASPTPPSMPASDGSVEAVATFTSSRQIEEDDLALSCPICLELLNVPVMLPCCQQTFCKLCLRQALGSGTSTCPLCRASARMEQCLPNRSLEALLARCRGSDIESSIPNWPSRRRPNVFLPEPAPRRRIGSVASWWSAHAPCVRCVCMVASVAALMMFLRVEEEEYARETGYLQNGRFHQNTGYLPALSHAHASETLRRAKTGADGARIEPRRDPPLQRSPPESAT